MENWPVGFELRKFYFDVVQELRKFSLVARQNVHRIAPYSIESIGIGCAPGLVASRRKRVQFDEIPGLMDGSGAAPEVPPTLPAVGGDPCGRPSWASRSQATVRPQGSPLPGHQVAFSRCSEPIRLAEANARMEARHRRRIAPGRAAIRRGTC